MTDLDQSHLARLAPGTVVADRYKIIRRIGQGGISIVYEVEHLALAKRFALKIIRWRNQQSPLIERLRREALALSRIKHPNIVNITDFGTTQDGQIFYVMELLGGATLAWIIVHRGAYSMSGALSILAQTAHALVAAHHADIIHRDLKPENIIIEGKEDAQGERRDVVKILDFGLAKSLTPACDGRLTAEGITVGTVGYTAPEQLAGRVVDGRSDIYSFGCIAFEMFTGSQVFSGNAMHVAHAHLDSPPPLVRQRAPLARVTGEMERLIARCLAKDPAERPQTMTEVLEELRRVARVTLTPAGRTWVDVYLPITEQGGPQTKEVQPIRRAPADTPLNTPPGIAGMGVSLGLPQRPRCSRMASDSNEMTTVQDSAASAAPPVPVKAAVQRCLLVESDPAIAARIEEQLSTSGFAVLRTDGATAIDAARASAPAFILLSVELLSLSGYAICNRLKKDRSLAHIPVVLMTQDAADDIFCLHQTLPLRANAYLAKPFSKETLFAALAKILEAPAAGSYDVVAVTDLSQRPRIAREGGRRFPALLLVTALALLVAAAIILMLR